MRDRRQQGDQGDGTRQQHALAFTAGKLPRPMPQARTKSHTIEEQVRSLLGSRATGRIFDRNRWDQDVLQDRADV